MKMLLTIILAILINNSSEPAWSEEELRRADTAREATYLTEDEKEVIMLINLARMDGKKYLQTFFQEYKPVSYEAMKASSNQYMTSLRRDLEKVNDLPLLLPDKDLWKAAQFHAKDTGKKGLTGHNSSDGTGFSKRLSRYVKGWNKIAENCSYGYNRPNDIVGQLLLDEGVPSLGHRKSIINPDLEYIGVAIEPHSKYRYNCVMDFCAKF